MSPRPLSPPPRAGFVHLAPPPVPSLPYHPLFPLSHPTRHTRHHHSTCKSFSINRLRTLSVTKGGVPSNVSLTRHSHCYSIPFPFTLLRTLWPSQNAISLLFNTLRTLCTKTPGGVAHRPVSSVFDFQLSTVNLFPPRRNTRDSNCFIPSRTLSRRNGVPRFSAPRSTSATRSKMLNCHKGATRFRRKLSRPEGMPGPTCPQLGGKLELPTTTWHLLLN